MFEEDEALKLGTDVNSSSLKNYIGRGFLSHYNISRQYLHENLTAIAAV